MGSDLGTPGRKAKAVALFIGACRYLIRESQQQKVVMHHEDLTSGVLGGLAWYYLLAAMMNAAAAAYVSYGEMVGEGASRVGLAPKTRHMPTWLFTSFFALYTLAILIVLGRQHLPGAPAPLMDSARRPTACWRSSRVPTRLISRR